MRTRTLIAVASLTLLVSCAPLPKGEDAKFDALKAEAEQGDAEAQVELGVMYGRGIGVPQDYAESMKWMRKSAEQGHAVAQFILGLQYDIGKGVPPDHFQGYMWLTLSAAGGYEPARESRDIVASYLTKEQIAEAQKLAREWKPTTAPGGSE